MERTMTIRRTLARAAALLVAVSALSAFQATPPDLTGIWTGSLDRSDGSSTVMRGRMSVSPDSRHAGACRPGTF